MQKELERLAKQLQGCLFANSLLGDLDARLADFFFCSWQDIKLHSQTASMTPRCWGVGGRRGGQRHRVRETKGSRFPLFFWTLVLSSQVKWEGVGEIARVKS